MSAIRSALRRYSRPLTERGKWTEIANALIAVTHARSTVGQLGPLSDILQAHVRRIHRELDATRPDWRYDDYRDQVTIMLIRLGSELLNENGKIL